jgi:hypothetical protein
MFIAVEVADGKAGVPYHGFKQGQKAIQNPKAIPNAVRVQSFHQRWQVRLLCWGGFVVRCDKSNERSSAHR